MSPRRLLLACSLLAAPVFGQHALYVEHKGEAVLVREVNRSQPYVEDNGKMVLASGSRYGLQKVDEYAPVNIAIHKLDVSTHEIEVVGGGTLNRQFRMIADFESSFNLKRVFLVLDLKTENAGSAIFVREIGELFARQPKHVELAVPMNSSLGQGRYEFHLFTDGQEVFHSKMPLLYVETTLDRMVAKRIAGVADAAPRPFVGPAPEYPPALRKAKTAGEASIRFTISPNGRIQDPEVASATHPEFGAAALAAARLWRFLPKVEKGRPVAAKANMPFRFNPDNPPPAKK
jgi:TonB family protein